MVRLLAADCDQFERLLSGRQPAAGITLSETPIADGDVLAMLAALAAEIGAIFTPSAWWIISGTELVGLLSITGLMEGGVIQIGYGIAPCSQGRGCANAAIGALVVWAKGDARVRAIYAETGIDNIASQRVLANNGFVQTGQRLDDEDGEVFCWRAEC